MEEEERVAVAIWFYREDGKLVLQLIDYITDEILAEGVIDTVGCPKPRPRPKRPRPRPMSGLQRSDRK